MYRFKHILCPTDFSDASLRTIQFAAYAVREYGGHLTLLHVDTYEKTPIGHFSESDSTKEDRRARVLSFCEERFRGIIGSAHLDADTTQYQVRFGTSYKEIIEEAEAGAYSAVAIATLGLGYSSPHLIGRTAERVVRLCRTPVLTLRPRNKHETWNIKTVLCPTDFSEYGNYALPFAVSIARQFKAKLLLLHATDLSVGNPEKLLEKFPDLSLYHEHAGEVAVERLVGRDVEPENTIERVVAEHDIDLVVMGTHGARGLRRVQIGNTTEEVIRRVTVPVLSITHPIHRTVFPRRFQDDYESAEGDTALRDR